MSSGSIDGQERAELEAAERGIRLTRPVDYKRPYSTLYSLMPEQLAQMSPETLVWRQQDEAEHQRIHQATVEYLYRNALGEGVTQQQIAKEFCVVKDRIRWRLKIYHGYYEWLAQRMEERARLLKEKRKRLQYYILDEKTQTLIPVDRSTATAWWNDWHVTIAEDEVGYYKVSTRALPWFEHHQDNPLQEPPVIFVTVIDNVDNEWRYFAWEKALEGHKKVVEFASLLDDGTDYMVAEIMVWGFSSNNSSEEDVEFDEEDGDETLAENE